MARSRPQAVATDRLDAMLTRLKLPGVRDQLDTSFLSSQVEKPVKSGIIRLFPYKGLVQICPLI